ncbi:FAD-binding domain-containing protein [Nocardia sp. NPDC046763]|uniref:FAD-binding domain-containing protein n=1 Tax=Nocardia sp. NPDC046763 TaxID=3155256 RepID=UPI0033E68F34
MTRARHTIGDPPGPGRRRGGPGDRRNRRDECACGRRCQPWAAGTDTRPNRVLNPIRQAERFDPDGEYVRRWLPELAQLPGARIHKLWRATPPVPGYPAPLMEFNGM